MTPFNLCDTAIIDFASPLCSEVRVLFDGEKIAERLAAIQTSSRAASLRAGRRSGYVRDILRGAVRKPTYASLHALAEALECVPGDLIGVFA